MATVTKHLRLPMHAGDLLEIVGNVTRTDWVPVITACTLGGKVRTLEMVGVGTVQERIYRRDIDAMILEYGLVNRPAVALHKASLQVQSLIEHGIQSALDVLSQLKPAAPTQRLELE
jgi:hypothetical protein